MRFFCVIAKKTDDFFVNSIDRTRKKVYYDIEWIMGYTIPMPFYPDQRINSQ